MKGTHAIGSKVVSGCVDTRCSNRHVGHRGQRGKPASLAQHSRHKIIAMSSSLRSSAVDSVAIAEKEDFTWKGSDEYSDLGDR